MAEWLWNLVISRLDCSGMLHLNTFNHIILVDAGRDMSIHVG